MINNHWIFIRGLTRGTGHWGDFIDRFHSQFPDRKFEVIDLPGNGEFFKLKSPTRISDYVEFIRSHSKFLKEKKVVNIFAISMGAMVAAEWAKQFPAEIESLTLVNTSSKDVCSFYQRFNPYNYLPALKGLLTVDHLKKESLILQMTANNNERIELFKSKFADYSSTHPVSVMNFLNQIRAAGRYSFPKLASVKTTFLCSKNDRLVDCKCSLEIAKKWQCQAHVHPTAGHDLMLDDPSWILEKLRT